MEPKEENKESMSSQKQYGIAAMPASLSLQLLTGLLEAKGFGKIPLESTSEFLKAAEKYGSTIKATVCITFKAARRTWLLHKNTPKLMIILVRPPTNNNTHTPPEKMVTP